LKEKLAQHQFDDFDKVTIIHSAIREDYRIEQKDLLELINQRDYQREILITTGRLHWVKDYALTFEALGLLKRDGYQFDYNGKVFDNFNITSAMVSLQWNPFSDYMQTPNGKLEIEKRFPKFTFQFTKSLPNILENDFDFGKIDFRIDYEKKYLNGQKSTVLAQFGYAFGALPLTHLYNTSPNNLTKDNLLQRITIAGKNSFETMFFNEFFSSEFAMLQLKHGFKRIEIFKKVKHVFCTFSFVSFTKF
jgi:hypothetical protein